MGMVVLNTDAMVTIMLEAGAMVLSGHILYNKSWRMDIISGTTHDTFIFMINLLDLCREDVC